MTPLKLGTKPTTQPAHNKGTHHNTAELAHPAPLGSARDRVKPGLVNDSETKLLTLKPSCADEVKKRMDALMGPSSNLAYFDPPLTPSTARGRKDGIPVAPPVPPTVHEQRQARREERKLDRQVEAATCCVCFLTIISVLMYPWYFITGSSGVSSGEQRRRGIEFEGDKSSICV